MGWMNTEDKLIDLLETFEVPVIRQGSLAEDEAYPETFFTFWNRYDQAESYYDNDMVSFTAVYYVNVYSTDADTAYDLLRQARDLLVENGFSSYRMGYDIESDEDSHVGRGMELQILTFKGGN